ncbi:MAG: M4 family metallopeptidase [Methylococcales bacterium]|nr:M4 family metallopeptidase [Methylococcales bacterium]
MNHIQFVIILVIFLLMGFSVAAENISGAEITVKSQQRLTDMREELGLDENHAFQMQSLQRDPLGQTHIRFQQYYHGVRIWGGEVITHTQTDGRELPPTTLALKHKIQVDISPKLSADAALAVVKRDLALSSEFSSKPTTELVIYSDKVRRVAANKATVLAGKLNAEDFMTEIAGYQLAYYIHTEINNPNDTRHTDYLINAHTGAIIEKWDSLLSENAIGNGKSQYSGAVSLNTNSVAGGFELRDLTRPVSGGNVIYNLDHSTSGTGTLYTDPDNTWGDGANFKEDPEPTTSANGQTAAVDAAYGIQATWDMYKNVFGRNGINGDGKPTYARVHYDNAFDNAFYSDSCMCITYGDGTKLQTLTSLDVAAHEFAHGVCMTTAKLIYNKESGGLNEANSDIMGAMAEFYMRGANGKGSVIPDTGGTWTQGEQITTPAFPLKMRFLYKPSKDGKSADAWSPTLEKLNVHYSSGPMNRAFYFLSQGATKTGETSTTYLPNGMTGIGNDKAAKIWFRALTTYMTPDTNYAGARIACIQAVRDLFPVSGAEEIAVWNAFAGINVGNPWSGADAPPTVTVSEAGDKGTLTFSATATDDNGVVKVDFLLDSVLVGTSTATPYTMSYDSLMQDDGSHTLVAKATDTTGQYTNATMDFTINNGQLVRNGSFEKGYGVGWSNTTGMQIGTILGQTAFDGTKMAKFCGTGSKMSVGLFQSITIPANTPSAKLSYALHIETKDTSTSVASDTFAVQIRNASGAVLNTLATYSNLNAATGYKVYNLDLSAYKGQTVQLYFLGAEDGALATGFILDKVNLIVSGGGGDLPPTVSVSESGTSGTISFSATATDDIGVTKVEFYVDNSLKGTDTSSPYSMTLDSLSLKNGTYTLVGKAYDAAGNIGTSASIPFTVNNPETPTTYKEVENNNTTQTANLIADSVTKISGYIGTSSDKDYFKINVAAGRSITINMTGPAADYDLYLLNSSGVTLRTSANAGANESVTYKNASATTATYYIKVVPFGGAYTLTTPYSLALSR